MAYNKIFKNIEYVIVDIETTGLDPEKGAELIMITAYRINNNQIVDKFHRHIKPSKKITPEVTAITNITNELVVNAKNYKEVVKEFYSWWGNIPLVTDNLSFICKFFKYYDELYDILDYPKNTCYELLGIVTQKYNNIKTRSSEKILSEINPSYFKTKKTDEYSYVDAIWNVIQKVYDVDNL